jgi:hypothetical protein
MDMHTAAKMPAKQHLQASAATEIAMYTIPQHSSFSRASLTNVPANLYFAEKKIGDRLVKAPPYQYQ